EDLGGDEMRIVRTHLEFIIKASNSSRKRRLFSLGVAPFLLVAGIWLISVSAAGAPSKGTAPNPPSGLTVSALSATSLSLQWRDNSTDEASFSVFRCQGASCTPFSKIATTGANTTVFTDTGLSGGITYGYYITAVGKGGKSSTP